MLLEFYYVSEIKVMNLSPYTFQMILHFENKGYELSPYTSRIILHTAWTFRSQE
jgi:hypothetical protein